MGEYLKVRLCGHSYSGPAMTSVQGARVNLPHQGGHTEGEGQQDEEEIPLQNLPFRKRYGRLIENPTIKENENDISQEKKYSENNEKVKTEILEEDSLLNDHLSFRKYFPCINKAHNASFRSVVSRPLNPGVI